MALPQHKLDAIERAVRRHQALNELRRFVFECRCRIIDLDRRAFDLRVELEAADGIRRIERWLR
jgi:hypothetical protein